MKISRVHHVAIIVSDYERSKRFYADILGLPIVSETYRSERNSWKLDLAVGESYQIELFSFPAAPARLSYPEAVGLRHLAFEVENMEVSHAELRNKNIKIEPIRIDPLTGKKFTFFHDPDGLPLELYER